MPDAAQPGDPLRVLLDGPNAAAFTGWTDLVLERQIDALSGGFKLSSPPVRPWPLTTGAPVRIELAGEVLLDGHVEELTASSSRTGRAVEIKGRDKTGDMVDCAATNEPGEFKLRSLFEIAQQLAKPFGVKVESRHATEQGDDWLELIKPFEKFALRQGETAWSALERALRTRGFLGFTTGAGRIAIERPGPSRLEVALVEGENVLGVSLKDSTIDRFSTYTVRSQAQGSDQGWGTTVAEIQGTATDPNVTRFRPWLDFGETALTFESATERAAWEASVRAARAKRVQVDVQGWRMGRGLGVWQPNRLVDVHASSIGLGPVEMLIARVSLRRGRQGEVASLELRPAEAFRPAPEVPVDESFDGSLDSPEWSEE